jgi:preprotein translocase subunit SecB
MQASPVQTRSIIYRRVEIVPHLTADDQVDELLSAFDFDWNGVRLETATGCNIADETPSDASAFVVSLRLKVKNEAGKQCPYRLDVELLGLIVVNQKLPAERREELATVNGLAIVYGAAREMITTITSRMEYGPLTLPGVNFQDQVSQQKFPLEPAGQ